MKSISGKDFIKILEKNGWTLLRIKGSHYVYSKSGSNVRISVPVHGNKKLKIGLLKHLITIAGLDEQDIHK